MQRKWWVRFLSNKWRVVRRLVREHGNRILSRPCCCIWHVALIWRGCRFDIIAVQPGRQVFQQSLDLALIDAKTKGELAVVGKVAVILARDEPDHHKRFG